MMTDTETAESLERMIDARGLRYVLDIIAGICSEKASHIRSNWQDHTTATGWEDASTNLDRVSAENLPS